MESIFAFSNTEILIGVDFEDSLWKCEYWECIEFEGYIQKLNSVEKE